MARWLPQEFRLEINQREVDFVVPRLDADLPLCIDPFLLFKSQREGLRNAHQLLLSLFEDAFAAFRRGDQARVERLISFPEVQEIRFGYAQGSTRGSGVGEVLSRLLIDTLRASPALLDRGIRHAEELQLFSIGIAEDRVSDMAANVMKQFLVSYTQAQSGLWGLPLSEGVPLQNVWDVKQHEWIDQYVSLPVDPQTGIPILLVPRWVVRRLPWINYPDFLRMDLAPFLRSRLGGSVRRPPPKAQAVAVTRTHVDLVDSYVRKKERDALHAQPDAPPLLADSPPLCDDGVKRLLALGPGRKDAYDYQRLALHLLNCLFEPELVDGQPQVRSASGVEIRDLVFTNNSDLPFLSYLRTNYDNALVVFELKNTQDLEPDDVNQLANYLGDAMGRCGFLLTRNAPSARTLAKARATFNKLSPRRAIIVLSDQDLERMASLKRTGTRHPGQHLQAKYREFVQSIE